MVGFPIQTRAHMHESTCHTDPSSRRRCRTLMSSCSTRLGSNETTASTSEPSPHIETHAPTQTLPLSDIATHGCVPLSVFRSRACTHSFSPKTRTELLNCLFQAYAATTVGLPLSRTTRRNKAPPHPLTHKHTHTHTHIVLSSPLGQGAPPQLLQDEGTGCRVCRQGRLALSAPPHVIHASRM